MADVATDVLEVIAKQAKVEPAKVARETELGRSWNPESRSIRSS